MSIYKESWECYGIPQRHFTQKSLISHVQFQTLTVAVIKVIGNNLCQVYVNSSASKFVRNNRPYDLYQNM